MLYQSQSDFVSMKNLMKMMSINLIRKIDVYIYVEFTEPQILYFRGLPDSKTLKAL